jgi:PAS domain S-box-containing protein
MRNTNILLVEDDGILAMHTEEMLSRIGYTVAGTLASGEEALDFTAGHQVDLVLMDIELSGRINGITTAEQLYATSNVPIVFLTGFSQDPLLEQAKIAAPYGYLIKPVPERELAATIEMALHRHSLDRQLQENRLALSRSEAKYRHLFENSPLGIFRTTLDGTFLTMNNEMARIVGCATAEEAVAHFTHLADRLYVDADRWRQFIEQLKANGAVRDFEYKARTKNGTTLWISMNARLTAADEGDEHHDGSIIDGFAVDITARKQAEEVKKKLQFQLLHAQKLESIGTLAGGIAHDFNNILGAILGYAEMAREDSPAHSMAARDLDQVINAGYRAKDLVKQILAFSRQAEAVKMHLQPAAIVKETVKLLRSSLPSTIAIEVDLAPDTGVIFVDPTQMHQILMNLCTNAYHAMETTGGTLSVATATKHLTEEDLLDAPHVQPGAFVHLAIKDTGEGIAAEIREKIFDPYFTTRPIGKGSGLGLSIVHGIVQSYGGFIRCESHPGEGTVFHIMLPALLEHPAPETKPFDRIPVGAENILFVDDEKMLCEITQAILQRLGYTVTTRTSSLEALNTFRNQPEAFDLVITDHSMPGMTGFDLARRMLQIRPRMPIILCTGYSNLISEEQAILFGIKGFALKPLSKDSLAALIRKVIDGRGEQAGLTA